MGLVCIAHGWFNCPNNRCPLLFESSWHIQNIYTGWLIWHWSTSSPAPFWNGKWNPDGRCKGDSRLHYTLSFVIYNTCHLCYIKNLFVLKKHPISLCAKIPTSQCFCCRKQVVPHCEAKQRRVYIHLLRAKICWSYFTPVLPLKKVQHLPSALISSLGMFMTRCNWLSIFLESIP